MNLLPKQIETREKIKTFAPLLGVDINWALAIAMVESSLGVNQISPTGCKGVFQMSSIAMKDLHNLMSASDDDLADIVCGLSFLSLLKKRWKTTEEATAHFCDPKEIDNYLSKVKVYMKVFENG